MSSSTPAVSKAPENIELKPSSSAKCPDVGTEEALPMGHTISQGPYKGYTVVKVEEKHGVLHRAIPAMPLPLAIICCIINIIAPGVGTLLSSFACLCCGSTRLDSPGKAFCLNLVSAILQMLTFLLIVGWIWSIIWGMNFVQLARTKTPQKGYEKGEQC